MNGTFMKLKCCSYESDQVLGKRKAIFYHQSQKDGVMFKGDDHREFWVRAEERNANTAKDYKSLALPIMLLWKLLKVFY